MQLIMTKLEFFANMKLMRAVMKGLDPQKAKDLENMTTDELAAKIAEFNDGITSCHIKDDCMVFELNEEFYIKMLDILNKRSGVIVGAIKMVAAAVEMFSEVIELLNEEIDELVEKYHKNTVPASEPKENSSV